MTEVLHTLSAAGGVSPQPMLAAWSTATSSQTTFSSTRMAGFSSRTSAWPGFGPKPKLTSPGPRPWTPSTRSSRKPERSSAPPRICLPNRSRVRWPTLNRTSFSFCVALYEALYRTRPFHGRTLAELDVAITSGRIEPGDPRGRIPAAVRSAIIRGLSVKPDDRFDSMDELLERIPDPTRNRWFAPVAIGLGILGGAAVVAAATVGEGAIDCEEQARDLVGLFDRTELEAHLDADQGGDAWPRLERALQDYAEGWGAVRRQACEAERTVELAEPVREARDTCLYRAGLRYRMLLGELKRDPPPPAIAGLRAATSLPAPSECIGLEGEGGTFSSSAELEELLSQAKAAYSLDNKPRVVALATDALAKAEESADRRAQAEALKLLATAYGEGDTEEAEAQLRHSIRISTELGDHSLTSRSWGDLAFMLIHGRRDIDNAEFALDMADAEARRTDDPPHARILRLRNRIEHAAVAGNADAGHAALRQVEELLASHDVSRRSSINVKLAEAQFALAFGDNERMLAAITEVRDAWAELLGPNSPSVHRYQLNVGLALVRNERFEEARAELDPLLEVELDPVARAAVLWNLGRGVRQPRRAGTGSGLRERGRRRPYPRPRMPPPHRMLEARLHRSAVLTTMGQFDEAEQELDRAELLRERGAVRAPWPKTSILGARISPKPAKRFAENLSSVRVHRASPAFGLADRLDSGACHALGPWPLWPRPYAPSLWGAIRRARATPGRPDPARRVRARVRRRTPPEQGPRTKRAKSRPTPDAATRSPAELSALGQEQRLAGSFREAAASLEDARDQLDAQPSPDLVLRGEVLYQLGAVYSAQRRLPEATATLKRALDDAVATHGPQSYAVAVTKQALGGVYDYAEKYDDAEAMFRDAIVILRKLEGPDSLDVAQARANLALNLDYQGRDDDALAEYRAVMKSLGDRDGPPGR